MSKTALTLLLAALFIASCGTKTQQTAKETQGVYFDSIQVDSTSLLSTNKDGPQCKLSIHLQYAKGGKADKINTTLLRSGILEPDYFSPDEEPASIKMAVDSFVKRYIKEYQRDYAPLYRDDQVHKASYNCTYSVRTKTENGGGDIINYIASIYVFGGGAHGITQTLVKNFDAKTGQLITLNDIFVPGYEQSMKELLIEKMAKKFNVKDLEELKSKYIFADNHVYVPENFILKDDKLTFIYCEDEIAPHAAGEIRIEFNRSEIKRLCK